MRSVNNGSESVRFKGPQLWQTLPSMIHNSESLHQFKAKIKTGSENIVDVNCAFLFVIMMDLTLLPLFFSGTLWLVVMHRVGVCFTESSNLYLNC